MHALVQYKAKPVLIVNILEKTVLMMCDLGCPYVQSKWEAGEDAKVEISCFVRRIAGGWTYLCAHMPRSALGESWAFTLASYDSYVRKGSQTTPEGQEAKGGIHTYCLSKWWTQVNGNLTSDGLWLSCQASIPNITWERLAVSTSFAKIPLYTPLFFSMAWACVERVLINVVTIEAKPLLR